MCCWNAYVSTAGNVLPVVIRAGFLDQTRLSERDLQPLTAGNSCSTWPAAVLSVPAPDLLVIRVTFAPSVCVCDGVRILLSDRFVCPPAKAAFLIPIPPNIAQCGNRLKGYVNASAAY